ncbi:hypothetical protein BH09SUM1_BH09SUM1_23150 [soil metagenome]
MKTTTRNFNALLLAAAMATGISTYAVANDMSNGSSKSTSAESHSSYQTSSSMETTPAPKKHGWFYRLFHGKDKSEAATTTTASDRMETRDTTTDAKVDVKADTTVHNETMNTSTTNQTSTTTETPGSRSAATYNETAGTTTATSTGVGVPREERAETLSADEKAFRDGGSVARQ